MAKERFILSELHSDEKKVRLAFILIVLILLVLLGNSFYLTFVAGTKKSPTALTATPSPTSSITQTPTPTVTPPIPTLAVQQLQQTIQQFVKEYFIPFGIGSNQTSDWADIPGAQATVNFGNYQNIKEIVFETSVAVPTANQTVSVRLYNQTDKHPVWYSEVTTTNNVFATSQPIVWDSGTKVYQVQMKTQLSYLANLTLARLHITLR